MKFKQSKLDFTWFADRTQQKRAIHFERHMVKRRTVRDFSSKPIPDGVLDAALYTAASSPSGANRQPWRFVVIESQKVKEAIRIEAEKEEREFYERRAPEEWLEALEPLGVDANKAFLTEAPALIAVFLERYGLDSQGKKVKNYYMPESVGIATGILIAALHYAGLATLTHTPSPMKFLNRILDRPKNERPYLLLVVGYPKPDTMVPNIERLPFDSVVSRL